MNIQTRNLLFACLILLASCSPDPKKKETGAADSLAQADSLNKAPLSDAEAQKAIANIKFGINEKQFEEELTKFKRTLEHNEFQTIYAVGAYMVSDFAGSFHQDSLYKVSMLGDLIPRERYNEELLPQVADLKAAIEETHGSPDAGHGAPALTKTTKGYSYTAYSWTKGPKAIAIKVANRGIYFSCDLIISLPEKEQSTVN